MTECLHIVSFNVPYPDDYGGVIDVFNRIRNLKKCGVKIILHCFQYGREKSPELEKYCEKVYYYQRKTGFLSSLSISPYIVKSRENKDLIYNLKRDEYPILLEGLHCGALIGKLSSKGRKIYLRAHNVEHDYYFSLAKVERNFLKKLYYRIEATKLKNYEPVLRQVSGIVAVTKSDADHFSKIGCDHILTIPTFQKYDSVGVQVGRGSYILYHANLSVAENENAAIKIARAMENCGVPIIIAGKSPSSRLMELVNQFPEVSVVPNPSDEELDEMISNAHINFLYSDQATGMKLKLLNSLYMGRFCLVNSKMVSGTDLDSLCEVVETVEDMREMIPSLMKKEFTQEYLSARRRLLESNYDNYSNALKIKQFMGLTSDC